MALPVQLPADLSKKYRFTRPIYGGPVFDFPQYGLKKINLSTITEQQAERLLRAGWAGIERIPDSEQRAAAAEARALQKSGKSSEGGE